MVARSSPSRACVTHLSDSIRTANTSDGSTTTGHSYAIARSVNARAISNRAWFDTTQAHASSAMPQVASRRYRYTTVYEAHIPSSTDSRVKDANYGLHILNFCSRNMRALRHILSTRKGVLGTYPCLRCARD